MILLDTHVWIWRVNRDRRLTAKKLKALDALAVQGPLLLSDISLWEVEANEAKGNVILPAAFDVWLPLATSVELIELQRISVAVVREIRHLGKFHKDPRDRIIAATALVLDVELATHDANIIRTQAVPIWKP